MCGNGQKCYFSNQKKVKQKDSEYKNSSLVSQIDCKNKKENSKLLVKCFVNSFIKNPPISARNVPKIALKCHFLSQEKSQRKG